MGEMEGSAKPELGGLRPIRLIRENVGWSVRSKSVTNEKKSLWRFFRGKDRVLGQRAIVAVSPLGIYP
jgi:hypothetical protein